MKGFFNKIQNDVNKAINKNNPNYNRGGGQSLGGSKPGKLITDIYIVEKGSIGIKLENTSDNTAIIGDVSQGGTAEAVGLQRGDIICHPNTNGMKEIQYREFLNMVKSSDRPLIIDVRRMLDTASSSSTAAKATSKSKRADTAAKRQAVIEAAEKRDKINKIKKRPIPKTKGGKAVKELTQEEKDRISQQKEDNIKRNAVHMSNEPKSEEAQRAIIAAKHDEMKHAGELGYNPYEVRKVTGQQASNATIAVTHGPMSASDNNGGIEATTIPVTRAPAETMIPAKEVAEPKKKTSNLDDNSPINDGFDNALATLVTSNSEQKVPKSLRILRKLILNATNAPQNDAKRQVRVSDPNELIKAAIVDMEGAFDLLMSVGFIFSEIDDKTFLVYDDSTFGGPPAWLPLALERMENYGNGQLSTKA